MPRRDFDLTLYLVVGTADVGARPIEEVVEAAVAGGVTLVQLREKSAPKSLVLERARRLNDLLARRAVPLIVNDYVDLVVASGAAGVHLGQEDADAGQARATLGPRRIVGVSAGNAAEAARIDPAVADYAGIGPAYASGSKADAGAAIGLDGIRDLRARLSLPLVAIGGITAANAGAVMRCGVEGVAVVSAICAAADPEAAARDLRLAVEAAAAGIRLAEPGDVARIKVVVDAAYAIYLPRMEKPPGPMRDDYEARVRDGEAYVLEEEGRIVGALVLCDRGDHLLLDNIALQPAYQGRGLGRCLLAFAEAEAACRGYGEIRLYTNAAMTENVAFYLRQGYEETGRGEQAGYERVFMRKRLAPESAGGLRR